jgi:hypothetical protein
MIDEIIPFGKHKGKPVFALAEDKSYAEWLLAQPWFKERHINIYNVVINNFRQHDDTPEHNAMQIKFLDQSYALKLAYYLDSKLFNLTSRDLNKAIRQSINSETAHLDIIKKELPSFDKTKLLITSIPTFEQGYDVAYSVKYGLNIHVYIEDRLGYSSEIFKYQKTNYLQLFIEIKPTIGDDYPSILRQIKASMPVQYEHPQIKHCLLVGTYTGVGATKEQFVQFFQSQKYKVIFESDINNVQLPPFEEEFQFDSEVIV